MASSHQTMFVLLLLTALPSILQASRMAPSDHIGSVATAPSSQFLTRDMAPPMPPLPPAGKPEIAVGKRWGDTQVVADGSVPSPGVGHKQLLQWSVWATKATVLTASRCKINLGLSSLRALSKHTLIKNIYVCLHCMHICNFLSHINEVDYISICWHI